MLDVDQRIGCAPHGHATHHATFIIPETEPLSLRASVSSTASGNHWTVANPLQLRRDHDVLEADLAAMAVEEEVIALALGQPVDQTTLSGDADVDDVLMGYDVQVEGLFDLVDLRETGILQGDGGVVWPESQIIAVGELAGTPQAQPKLGRRPAATATGIDTHGDPAGAGYPCDRSDSQAL